MRTWPDIAALELLVAVADSGSVSAAARRSGVAQPNASRSLARLERRLGVSLLQRSTSGSTLSPAGTVIVEWARDVLDATSTLLDGAEGLSKQQSGPALTVAASQTVAEHLLPGWLARLRRLRPESGVGMRVENSATVLDDVLHGRCELGFIEGPGAPKGVHSVVVAADDLVLVTAPDHPWARRRRPVTAAELGAARLVTRESGSGTRVALDDALGEYGPITPELELPSNAAVRVSVASGGGPAVLSRLAVQDSIARGDMREILVVGLDLSRSLRAVWTGPRTLRGLSADLVMIARESAQ